MVETGDTLGRAAGHNRMPPILAPYIWDLWFNGGFDAAPALMKPRMTMCWSADGPTSPLVRRTTTPELSAALAE